MAPQPSFAPAAERPAEGENFAAAAPSDLIWGRHAAQAALESGRPVHRIWCTPEMRFSPRFLQLLREAKGSGALVEEVTWARLGQISGGAVHQGIVLQPAAAETLDLDGLLEGCRGIGEAPLLLAVDGLTDPQNLGAIVRSAEALGAHGLVLPQRRNAGLTGTVAKVAAGALEHLPIARVVNLNRSLDTLKQEGYRVIGLAAEGNVSLEEADLDGPLGLVTGSEGEGLSLLTRRHCDQLVRIPLRGTTPSLNASVATALLLYEVARRSWMRGLTGSAPAPRLVRPALPSTPVRPPVAAEQVDEGPFEASPALEAPDAAPSSSPWGQSELDPSPIAAAKAGPQPAAAAAPPAEPLTPLAAAPEPAGHLPGPELDAERLPEPEPEPEPEAEAEPLPSALAEEAPPEPDAPAPEPQPLPQAATATAPEPGSGAGAEPQAQAPAAPAWQPGTGAELEPEPEPQPESESQPEPETQPEPQPSAQTTTPALESPPPAAPWPEVNPGPGYGASSFSGDVRL
jgi:23S rRNA (guanosine2251-2'-O)-methyltransferase